MNDLRLILIILGVIIILFVYFHDSVKSRKTLRKKVRKLISRNNSDELYSMKITPGDDIDPASELGKIINDSRNEPVPVKSFNLEPHSIPEDAGEVGTENRSNKSGEIVLIYIKAKPDKNFSGDDIFKAAEAAGMKPGSMDIFHHYLDDGDETGHTLFSLANMLEPGSFEFDNPGKTNTSGLVMFMQLPSLVEPSLVFDLMCHTAEKISADLGGELLDSNRKKLDSRGMTRIRRNLM